MTTFPKKAETLAELWQLMEETGLSKDRHSLFLWRMACSPIPDTAHRFTRILSARVEREAFKQKHGRGQIAIPNLERSALPLCLEPRTQRVIGINRSVVAHHTLLTGAPGSGKTTALCSVIRWAAASGIPVIFSDHKNEGPRLPNAFDDVVVLSPTNICWNLLAPPPGELGKLFLSAWFSELARAFALRPETSLQLISIVEPLLRGRTAANGFISLKELEDLLRKRGEGRQKFSTAAFALRALNDVLGAAAYVQAGPWPKHKVLVLRYHALPPRIHQLLSALHLLRTQFEVMAEGHTNELRLIYISDEANMEFGKAFAGVAGGHYISLAQRFLTQMRSFGMAIFAGAQMLSEVDESLKSNVGTFICFRTPNPKDAREATELLAIETDQARTLQTLSTGHALIRSEGFSAPIHGVFPFINLGAYPSEADLATRMAPVFSVLEQEVVRSSLDVPAGAERVTGEDPKSEATPAPAVINEPMTNQIQEFLSDIQHNSEASIAEHYINLDFGPAKGNKVKAELFRLGLVVSERQPSSNGRPRELLRLTEAGLALLRKP